MMPVETITLTNPPAEHKCDNCRHSIPVPIGDRVLCFVRDEQLSAQDSCCRWQVRPE